MSLNNQNYPDRLQALIAACERAKAKEVAAPEQVQPTKRDRDRNRAA